MNKVSKQLIKIAREIKALDEEGHGSGFQLLHDKDNFEQNQLDIAEKQGKKYILHHKEGNLWRIQACRDFNDVKKGDFGGLIQSEKNLSHDGDCWVCDDAVVCENAKVYYNAKVYENANVHDYANVYGKARVCGNAQVCENAQVYGDAQVFGNAKVYGDAQVFGNAKVYGDAQVFGNAKVDYDVKDQEIAE